MSTLKSHRVVFENVSSYNQRHAGTREVVGTELTEITVSSEVTIPTPEQLDVGDKGNDNPEVLEDTWYVCANTVHWKIWEATNK